MIEAVDHDAEVVLELRCIATCTEVASRSGLRQLFDLLIHRCQVVFDLRHGLGQFGLFAGQGVHVVAKVADRVAAHDLRQACGHLDVAVDQRIVVAGHAAVITWECIGIHAEAHLAGIVALGHVQLCGNQVTHLRLHLVHGLQQAAGFVAGIAVHGVVELALGNRLSSLGRAAQRPGEAAGDQQAQGAAQQHHQQRTADQQLARIGHRLQRYICRFGGELVLKGDVLADLVLPFLQCGRGLGKQQRQRLVAVAGHHQVDDLVVHFTHFRCETVDLGADAVALWHRRHRIQRIVRFGVVGACLLDGCDKFQIVFAAGRQHDIA